MWNCVQMNHNLKVMSETQNLHLFRMSSFFHSGIQLWYCAPAPRFCPQVRRATTIIKHSSLPQNKAKLQQYQARWLLLRWYKSLRWLHWPVIECIRPSQHLYGLCKKCAFSPVRFWGRHYRCRGKYHCTSHKEDALMGFPHTPHYHSWRQLWPEDCGRRHSCPWRDTMAGTVEWDTWLGLEMGMRWRKKYHFDRCAGIMAMSTKHFFYKIVCVWGGGVQLRYKQEPFGWQHCKTEDEVKEKNLNGIGHPCNKKCLQVHSLY